jgi:hypothetical protein
MEVRLRIVKAVWCMEVRQNLEALAERMSWKKLVSPSSLRNFLGFLFGRVSNNR